MCIRDSLWAYMLAASYLQPVSKGVYLGTAADAAEEILLDRIKSIDPASYVDKRVVIKGCGEKQIGEKSYLTVTKLLRPVAHSIMYGEPCSTVPVFKKSILGSRKEVKD